MCDCGKLARPAPGSQGLSRCGRALAQRALACELAGDLERAMALIRCLKRRAAHPDACERDRRIA